MQEELTKPGVLEGFLGDFGEGEVRELRDTWMGMWGLDAPADTDGGGGGGESGDGIVRARRSADKLVLKPQREGGGNNVYTTDIPAFLDTLPEGERAAWIAMRLIEPPGVGGYLVRAGAGSSAGGVVQTEVISELGIFGWALFGGEGDHGKGKNIEEEEVGWLVRTKGKDSNEGGVAAGFSVLDSLVLVDG